ncbi:MAG: hypothetical protein JNJ73_07140 [Hyphomonadaceae bacterium]|nr:hypothetical protein [Hyphomonadaceae bacterium]
MRNIIALAALVLMSCAPVANEPPVAPTPAPVSATKPEATSGQASAGDCASRGGSMQPVGRMQSLQCVVPFADAGRACTDGSQCASGRCIGEAPVARPTGAASGVCQRTNFQFGCFATIVGGRQQAVLCVD